jgi:hypothetical protein
MDFRIPTRFDRLGCVVGFGSDRGTIINGDPCIVWDAVESAWRMFYFCLPPGHAHAICRGDPAHATSWQDLGPLVLTNGETLPGGIGFKPFAVLDPLAPNRAAKIDGRYCLVLVTNFRHREIRRAWSTSLAGPWTLETEPVIAPGGDDAIDGKHVEAPSAYWLEDRREFLYFYMATPKQPQQRAASPLGSCQAAAVQTLGEPRARKLGPILEPSAQPGHWTAGWIGGLQLVGRRGEGWVALVNAGANAPQPGDTAITQDEPPPSLGGFAVTDDPDARTSWRAVDAPIERIEAIPEEAIANGEGTNLWRHHLLALPDGRRLIFYNSGPYAREQLFAKRALD